MRTAVEMPRWAADAVDAGIVEWFKAPGETVARGEAIAEIETDKSTVDMEATAAGTLAEIVHQAGDEVPVGEPIAFLDDGS